MPPTRDVLAYDWRVRLDLSRQVVGVEVPDAVVRWDDGDGLLPTLPGDPRQPVSASALLLKAKQFDDGLYAAVDLAAQRGHDRFRGKAAFLLDLANAQTAPGPAATVRAAARLGGVGVPGHPTVDAAADALAARFLGDELASKPLGLYTWTPELAAVFRQDRFLQQPLEPTIADALADAISADPILREDHDAVRRLAARMTNPAAGPGLFDADRGRAVLPASRSHEGRLVERLFGDRPVPPGFDLLAEIVRRVRSGELDLTPAADAGWYDRQAWSLEPLAAPDHSPEATRLRLGPRYRRHLEDVFRGALALARESHVKQLSVALGGCAGPWGRPIPVRPDLSVEPVPEVHARRAAGYRFVREVLSEAFGDDWRHLRRLTADGPVEEPLGGELDRTERLFESAAAAARFELGLDAAGDPGAFHDWRAALGTDPDLARDARIMVPVYHDVRRRETKVWAFLGWRPVPADVRYETPPTVLSIEPSRPPEPEPTDRLTVLRRKLGRLASPPPPEVPTVVFSGDRCKFLVPVVAEVPVTRLLDRDEFRRHCDRHRTRAAILANLE